MSVNAASGFPQQSGILIPEIWSGKMLVEFYETAIVPSITNSDWEGEVKKAGDTVKIRSLPVIYSGDYSKGQELDYQLPEEAVTELLVDKAKYWAFRTDMIDENQSDLPFVEKRIMHAAETQKEAVTEDFFQDIIADGGADNIGNTAGVRSNSIKTGALGGANGANHVGLTNGATGTANKFNVLDFITNLTVVADEAKWPTDGRWVAAPSWLCRLIRTSDMKDASISGDSVSPLRNGLTGNIDGWNIYKTNQLYSVADSTSTSTTPTVTYLPFGHMSAITFAAQFTDTYSAVSERFNGKFYRGFTVYGHETVKPDALGMAIVRPVLSTDS